MNVRDLLRSYRLIFLDTAPLIFYAERHPVYYALVEPVFAAIDAGEIQAVTSLVTLAECLVHPYMKGLTELQRDYYDLITRGNNVYLRCRMQRQAGWLPRSVHATASPFSTRFK